MEVASSNGIEVNQKSALLSALSLARAIRTRRKQWNVVLFLAPSQPHL